MANDRLTNPARRAGPIIHRFADIHDLPPEATGFTPITFQASISSSSITQPANVNVPTDRDFWLHGIAGYHNESGSLADAVLVTAALKVNNDVPFISDLNMAMLVTTVGAGAPLLLPNGGLKIPRSAVLSMEFKRASGFSSNTRTYGIVLLGDLLR